MSIIDKVMKSQDVTLLQFKASWCKPCERMQPVMDALDPQLLIDIQPLDMDNEDVSQMAQHFGVRTIPCFVLVQGGQEISSYRSSADLPTMKKWLKDYLVP